MSHEATRTDTKRTTVYFVPVRVGTDPLLHIVDYLSGGRYTSWWLRREPGR